MLDVEALEINQSQNKIPVLLQITFSSVKVDCVFWKKIEWNVPEEPQVSKHLNVALDDPGRKDRMHFNW